MQAKRTRNRRGTGRLRRAGCWMLAASLASFAGGLLGEAAGGEEAAPRAGRSFLDLRDALVITPASMDRRGRKAVSMLVDEVARRSQVRWEVSQDWPDRPRPVVVVGRLADLGGLRSASGEDTLDGVSGDEPEGFTVRLAGEGAAPVVWVAGNDSRGVLFGVGRLLRALRISRQEIRIPVSLRITTAPRTPLRGHQLGYRPKTNSYDGWTVSLWEQYIRDLAVFGTNAIELIPPRSDDAADSPHFPLAPMDMMVEMSRLADDYGLDVWIWYPAIDGDYSDPNVVNASLLAWGEVLSRLPRVDAVFVPGGDPGDTPPGVLIGLLEKQAENLRRHHPRAGLWVSPQGFSSREMEEFYSLLDAQPSWLTGVVFGPQVRVDLAALRARVPPRYPIRDYPDITHSRHCQYPVPDWDVAFAATEGREVTNPRPLQMARIFRLSRPWTAGFITYSEGCHDDVNKIVWSALGWDPAADVREVLEEYARYFIGPEWEERFADALLGLERNWRGPALGNADIDATLQELRAIEAAARPGVKLSWRFQQALYRASYDAYVRARLRAETAAVDAARARLRDAAKLGSLAAIEQAEAALERPRSAPPAAELRCRIFQLAEALFQSIHAQLSVERYDAIAVERGANLDSIDAPLTDAGWLGGRLADIRALESETARRQAIERVLGREDPGPGGFHDDVGDPAAQPHLVRGRGFEEDPAFHASSLVGFGFRGDGPDAKLPVAWWRHAEALYDAPLEMRYAGLDPAGRYRVRVVYGRERRSSGLRLTTGDGRLIHDYLSRPLEPLEFDIPAESTARGELTLRWNQEPGGGGNGRGCQVCEVWLVRE